MSVMSPAKSALNQTAWSSVAERPADGSCRRLRDIVAVWEERRRLRFQFEQMSKADPHLIDDIGLTRGQVAAEIAKPFWRG